MWKIAFLLIIVLTVAYVAEATVNNVLRSSALNYFSMGGKILPKTGPVIQQADRAQLLGLYRGFYVGANGSGGGMAGDDLGNTN